MDVTLASRTRSFIRERNLHDSPFKQYSSDGTIKREYLNHGSFATFETVSD